MPVAMNRVGGEARGREKRVVELFEFFFQISPHQV
jgi:hypothetical protein